MKRKNKPLLIIDGYGFVYRAYHVQPPLTSSDGQPVGAIYGLISMLIKLINDFKPESAVVVLDSKGKNFRHELFKEYKANRPPAPDDLVSQLSIVRSAVKALNFCVLEKEGFEADDIIATLAIRCQNHGQDAVIISADKDLLQLMDDKVKIYDPSKAKFISNADVMAKFGVAPSKVREVQALMGDSSDNIPGVKGIGPKGAAELVNTFGDLKGVYDSIDKVKTVRVQELLKTYKDDAFLSWQLVGLDANVDLGHDFESFHWEAPASEQIREFIDKYGFRSLQKRIDAMIPSGVEPELVRKFGDIEEANNVDIAELLYRIEADGIIGVSFEEKNAHRIVSIRLGDKIYRFNYEPSNAQINVDLFSYSKKEMQPKQYNEFIDKIFADVSIKKITRDLKNMYKYFNTELNGFDDLNLMEYCLSAGKAKSDDALVDKMDYIDVYEVVKTQLFKQKTLHLYETIDLPLCKILHQMEFDGVKIDITYLQKLSNEFGKEIVLLEKEIFNICGEEFNISSPKQLGIILFDKLKLPFSKVSGKSKTYVTSVDILEKLSDDGHKVADLILKYRHLTKLKNTYIQTLPKQADKMGRVHTTFIQTSTTTGRLSSKDPNVQNIPVRTKEGNSIRAAFIAKNGCMLISADYSQVELRILSHVANIPELKSAFINGLDIHAQTASQIFAVPMEEVTPELRQKAKAINFGIIYGISGFGLAKNLNISKKEAADYIAKYFQEYPGIEKYMAETIAFAHEHEYVQNLLGRRCYVPMINQKNHALSSFAERAAINAPMQSLTADIAKMAMVAVDKKLRAKSFETKMLMQIHDELIFEAPEIEVAEVVKIIKETMEGVVVLDVPLKVDVSCGNNWSEL